jgi:hypothetical protein
MSNKIIGFVVFMGVLATIGMASANPPDLDRWCNPAFPFFQQRNAFQLGSVGNWSQTISFLLPLNPSNPGDFTYVGGLNYFQINYYNRSRCGFLSVQLWPNFDPTVFPTGVYFQTVAQDIIVNRLQPACLQQYDVYYLTPPVPVVPNQASNTWTSVNLDDATLCNSVLVNGTSTPSYIECITVIEPNVKRLYLPGTVDNGQLSAIAPFVSIGVPALPAPYNSMAVQYMNGQVPLVEVIPGVFTYYLPFP